MKMHSVKTRFSFLAILLFFTTSALIAANCPECVEVAKGKIPAKFLNKSLKKLPSGIAIWDVDEAIPALRKGGGKLLWVDTRPKSFYVMGSVKNAIELVCDLKGVPIPESTQGPALTKEHLMEAMKKVDANFGTVTVIFFCQGPECHRSYDAAIRAVQEYGLAPDKVIWFRDGYPVLEKHIMEDPKLKKRIDVYLQGDVLKS